MNIEIGSSIVAQYGATIPTVYGVVTAIEDGMVYFRDQYSINDLYSAGLDSIKQLKGPDELMPAVGVYVI